MKYAQKINKKEITLTKDETTMIYNLIVQLYNRDKLDEYCQDSNLALSLSKRMLEELLK